MTDSEHSIHSYVVKAAMIYYHELYLYLMFKHAARFTLHISQHKFSITNLQHSSKLCIVYSLYNCLFFIHRSDIYESFHVYLFVYNRYTSLFCERKYCLIYSFFCIQ